MLANSKPVRVNRRVIPLVQLAIHTTLLLWLVWELYLAIMGLLPGDPIQYLIDFTGIGSLNLLLASLVISIVAKQLKFSQIMPLRRTLGIYSAFYALLHVLVFISLELQFEWLLIGSEIIKRPYITVGFASFVILLSLLLTSPKRIKKQLGSKWQSIHNFSYLALILALVHFFWSIKSEELEPFVYIVLGLLVLLLKRKKLKLLFT